MRGRRGVHGRRRRGVGPRPRGADVVHAPTLQVPPRSPAALVVTVHDAVPWTHPETMTPRGVAWRVLGHRTPDPRWADWLDLPAAPAVTAEAA